MKKYNNKSGYFKDWTTNKLKKEATSYYGSIYYTECYSVKDLLIYEEIMNELYNRGIDSYTELAFYKL